MKNNPLKDKSYLFAIDIVNICNSTRKAYKEFVLTNQLLRSGTSIGANIREAEFAQSRADFTSKMSISLKEASETEYWLNIFRDTGYINETQYFLLSEKLNDLLFMLISTVKKLKNDMGKRCY